MANIELLQGWRVGTTRPPRTATFGKCGSNETVVLVLGKGAIGTVFHINYKIDVKRFMTKQQRELCDAQGGHATGGMLTDPNVSVEP